MRPSSNGSSKKKSSGDKEEEEAIKNPVTGFVQVTGWKSSA